MSDTVLAAIVGAVAGIITGSIGALFAPWATWGIEKRKQKLAHRRELIVKWRKMVEDFAKSDRSGNTDDLLYLVERHTDFHSLTPHLDYSPKALSQITLTKEVFQGSTIHVFLIHLSNEISRIEKQWDLV